MSIFCLNEGASVLETCQCLLEFISTVISNTASDPGVLSFTLKLSGLIAATEDGFKMLQVELMCFVLALSQFWVRHYLTPDVPLQECTALDLIFNLQHWQGAGLWEDPCIRIGWILGLRSMLQHPKALSFFVQSGTYSCRNGKLIRGGQRVAKINDALLIHRF